ncbi:hypothetical protein ScPMuIL_015336 [Solemya velum]
MLETVLSFGSVTVFLFTFVLALTVYHTVTRTRGSPPGPPLWPVIGNLHLVLRKDTRNMLREMRNKYGDIFSLNIGYSHWIFINGYDVLKDMFVKNGDVTSERPYLPALSNQGNPLGIVSSSGHQWTTYRKFTLCKLRYFGFGSIRIEKSIQQEVILCLQAIGSHNQEPFDIQDLFITSISNIISLLLFNKRFDADDVSMKRIATNMSRSVENVHGLWFLLFPFLRKLSWALPLIETFGAEKHALGKLYNRHLSTYQDGVVRDFTDFCIQEQKKKKDNEDSLTELQCLGIMRDLYEAGTETTTTAMLWMLIHLIRQPEIQDRIRTEIDDVVGSDRLPSLLDRCKMPFTQATIMEVLRLENVVPFAVPHKVEKDLMFGGYFFPKSAMLWLNLDSVVKDAGIWKDPEYFRPSRFLDEEGNLTKKEEFIPFSLGRRVCLGESMAMSMLFLFLTSMLQKFIFLPASAEEMPVLDCVYGEFIHRPLSYKLRAVPRNLTI